MKLAAVASLNPVPVAGIWYRAIQTRFLAAPLAFGHTSTSPGRFNGGSHAHPGSEVIYLTEDYITAQLEVELLVKTNSSAHPLIQVPTTVAWTFLPIQVSLSVVADLTDPSELGTLDTSFQTLTGDWRGYSTRPTVPALRSPYFTNVPTQRLGHALYRARFEGFLTYSSRLTSRKNLIVFPTRLRKSSSVTYTDSAGTVHSPIP